MTEENIVFVGKKGTLSYVLAVVNQVQRGNKSVIIKARGKAISRAVDVAEIAKIKYLKGFEILQTKLSTEELDTTEGKSMKVSAIEITLGKCD